MGWRSHSLVYTSHPPITIIMQIYLRTLMASNACQVYSVGYMFKIELILLIIFYTIYEIVRFWKSWANLLTSMYPHGLNCRPGPCEGVAGAMSGSRVVCKVVQFTVKQRQLHASAPANELSWLLEPKFLATPAISSSQSRVEVNLSRQHRFEV